MVFICYSKCSTCIKAMQWLDEMGVDFELREIKENNPTEEELTEWHEKWGIPLKSMFNTSGVLYRQMGLKDKLKEMSDEEQIKLLATDGMLVKRPILIDDDGSVLIGFDMDKWRKKLIIDWD